MEKDNSFDDSLIEDFLDGKLTSEQNVKFQERLKTDKEFKELYDFRMKISEDWQEANEIEQALQQTKFIIEGINRKRNRRIIVYAIAATLALLVIIPGVIFIGIRNNNSPGFVDNNNIDTSQSYQPQLKLPEEKTSLFYIDTIILVSPLNDVKIKISDFVLFSWLPSLDSTEILVIENRIGNKVVFDKKIERGLETFTLEHDFLPVGEYYWYFRGLSAKDSFRIVK